MAFARVMSAQAQYLNALTIAVEADLSRGLHSFSVVGLADKAVDESRERVATAIKNSGFASPKHSSKRVLISLAPADTKKEGPSFDLPIALAYLLAAEEVAFNPEQILFLGELALDGSLRSIRGVLPLVRHAQQNGFETVVVPEENAREAALVEDICVLGAASLTDVAYHFDTKTSDTFLTKQPATTYNATPQPTTDFADIRGQESAKRGLTIAAAGRHNIVLYGPPGTGKTMLARALQGILPPLSFDEALEVTSIHSVAGTLAGPLVTEPPFRTPHHSASHTSLVGGGSIPRPGEVTLAHRGVLFLDEFPEFERRSIDALRQPLEDKMVSVSRVKGSTTFPANFILVAALNPSRGHEREVNELERERLKKKLSGPVVDRIDMWLEVTHIDHEKLKTGRRSHSESEAVRARVARARERQHERFGSSSTTNSDMSVRDIDAVAHLTPEGERTLQAASEKLDLSPRSYHRMVKLARTIADLEQHERIEEEHVLEALQYRPKGLFE